MTKKTLTVNASYSAGILPVIRIFVFYMHTIFEQLLLDRGSSRSLFRLPRPAPTGSCLEESEVDI